MKRALAITAGLFLAVGSGAAQSSLTVYAAPGAAYYLRVEIASGFMKGHGRLVLVQPGQGSVEVRKLQPLGADKVKDNSLVKAQR